MTDELDKLLYVLCGGANLLIAVFFTFGAAFSSYGVSALVAVFVDLPLALGLMAAIRPRKLFLLLMMFGCTIILIYIVICSYFRMKSGRPLLNFHVAWAAISVTEVALAFNTFQKHRNSIGVTSWPQ
jgi:hypothetical protein